MPTRPITALLLALGCAGAAAAAQAQHSVRIDHHSGPVTAHYRGDIAVDHRQIGAAAPAGRASTLRCQWTARMDVARAATAANGRTIHRSFVSAPVASGHRTGWCSGQQEAIARDVARQTITLDHHLQAVAREDHDVLRAELDALHGPVGAG